MSSIIGIPSSSRAPMPGIIPIDSWSKSARPPFFSPSAAASAETSPVVSSTSSTSALQPASSSASRCQAGARAEIITAPPCSKSRARSAYFSAETGERKATAPSAPVNSFTDWIRRVFNSPGPILSSTMQVRTASISRLRIVEL